MSLSVKVKTDANGGEWREYTFRASDDLDPGAATRFPIEVPKREYYSIVVSYQESGCGACDVCEDYCADRGSARSSMHGYASQNFEKGQNDNGGQDIIMGVYRGSFAPTWTSGYCTCASPSVCSSHRVGEDSGLGNFGGSGSGGGASSGGSATGGETSTGGVATGGETSTGGAATGGETSTGGAATGGESSTGGAASGGSTSVDPTCGEGMAVVGQYATWCGKVNVHTEGDAWASDSDCSSGCNINTVSYCQKFWPTATAQVQLETPTNDLKLFQDAGCSGGYSHKGFGQYACCAPLQ